jgi:outer membrane protein TolC
MKLNPLQVTQIGDKQNFIGVLKYSYPIFTGYLISSSIAKSKLEIVKEKLNLENLKRILVLNSVSLYSSIYAVQMQIKALNQAKDALNSAKSRAEAFYKEGLVNYSTLSSISAKYFNIISNIKNLESTQKELFNNLSYILNRDILKIDGLCELQIKEPNFEVRADVKALKKSLEISDVDIKMAKASFYPTIGFEAAISRQTNDVLLSQNDYTNKDFSYVALGIKYNLFDGNGAKSKLEIAKLSKIMNIKNYNNYLNKIKIEYQNDLNKLESLNYQLKASISEVKANEDYLAYIDGKFNEGLESVTNLNDAIASLAEARAKRDSIKARIFEQKVKLLINGGNYEFN